MDIFTHLLSGYLVSYWASDPSINGSPDNLYLILGTFMAIFPDIDVFLKPIWGRLPHVMHHGIIHSIPFIIISSTIIYSIITAISGFQDYRLLLLMYLTGCVHLFWDFVGTGGVRPFYPFQKSYARLNLEVGANPLLGIYSLLSFVFLLAISLKIIDFVDLITASLLVGAGYILDLGLRAALKSYCSSKPENLGYIALPTIAPNRWRFAKRNETKDGIEVILKTRHGPSRYFIPKANPKNAESCKDLASTYWLSQVQERVRIFNYPYYRINCCGNKKGITWNAAEMGRVMDVIVNCEGDRFAVTIEFQRSMRNYWDDLS